MKPLAICLLAGATSVAASALTVFVLAPGDATQAAPSPSTDVALGHSLQAIEQRLAGFERRLDEVAGGQELTAPAATRLSIGEIESAVRRVLADGGAELAPELLAARDAANTGGSNGADAAAGYDLEAALERLMAEDFDGDQETWNELREAGLLDEAVAHFEKLAEENPSDPEAQLQVGEAYLQKIFEVGSGPLAGQWAMKADGAFDRALALNDTHWEARFTKAVALSNWPAFLGKQPEAIKNFELLIQQQEHRPYQSGFEQTHLILGNMYQQVGQPEKALQVWQAGMTLYPDSDELRNQLALTQGDGTGR